MVSPSALEITQGQTDGFFSQLPYTCYVEAVACVGDGPKICPWVASKVDMTVAGMPGPARLVREPPKSGPLPLAPVSAKSSKNIPKTHVL